MRLRRILPDVHQSRRVLGMQLAMFSLKRAQQRLLGAKRKRESPDEDEAAEAADALKQVAALVNQASEIGDERPLTACEFSPDGSRLATASTSGIVKVWDVPGLTKTLTIRAHDSRVTGAGLPLCSLSPLAPMLCIGQTNAAKDWFLCATGGSMVLLLRSAPGPFVLPAALQLRH